MTRPGRGLLAAALIVSVTGCAGLGQAAPPDTPSPEATAEPTRKPRRTPRVTPDPAATPTPTPKPPRPTPYPDDIPGLSELLGSDGRLTVLLLGSDWRHGAGGERTDAIVVATIEPRFGKVAMVSLPRDTVGVPTAEGRVYAARINGLMSEIQRETGKRGTALKRLKSALEHAFGIEIDHYVLGRFRDVAQLVNAVGGVEVKLAEPLIDPTMRLSKRGLRLKAGLRRLDGRTALAFARTRHADSDYERSRRQHQLITSAVTRVRERGLDALPALVSMVRGRLETDIPLEAAPALLALAQRADLRRVRSVVLAPSAFASPGPLLYTIRMKLGPVRKMFDRFFAPVE